MHRDNFTFTFVASFYYADFCHLASSHAERRYLASLSLFENLFKIEKIFSSIIVLLG
jgi:hypothetical protein